MNAIATVIDIIDDSENEIVFDSDIIKVILINHDLLGKYTLMIIHSYVNSKFGFLDYIVFRDSENKMICEGYTFYDILNHDFFKKQNGDKK